MNGLKQLIAKEQTENMPSVVNHIRKSVPHSSIAAKIEEGGCQTRVTLNKKDYIIVNLNDGGLYEISKSREGRKADFLFANDAVGNQTPWNKSHMVVLELKGGESRPTVNDFISQFKAGVRLAEKLVSTEFGLTFHLVLVYTENKTEDRIHPNIRRRLGKLSIKFHGKPVHIKTLESGKDLSQALS